jgi:hypothetical protein
MAFDEVRLLAAWCELRGDFRHFRADRVLALEDCGQRYPDRRHALLRRWREQRLKNDGSRTCGNVLIGNRLLTVGSGAGAQWARPFHGVPQ